MTSIGNGVYYDCCSLEYIYIPKSVICLKGNPFYGWNGKLECFSLNFMYECDILFNKDKSRIISFRNQKQTSYVISNSVTSIGDHAFYGCSSLAEVIIPNSVTSIGDHAFYGCSSLSSIVIPDSVNSIGEGAFLNCSSLSSIVIPDSVNSIGDGAFSDCSSLSSIVIPNSVNSIGEGAFLNCSSLSSIVIPDSVNNIRRGAFYKCNLPYNLKQNFISRFSNELFMFPLKIPGFKSLYNYSKKNYGDN